MITQETFIMMIIIYIVVFIIYSKSDEPTFIKGL